MLPRSSSSYDAYRDHTRLRWLRRLGGFAAVVFLVYEIVTAFLVFTVEVRSSTMEPTLETGDRLALVPLAYGARLRLFNASTPGFSAPAHGDLVAVQPAFAPELGFLERLMDPFVRFFTLQNRSVAETEPWSNRLQVRRVIGLPGDTVRLERFVAYIRRPDTVEFVSEFALAERPYRLVTDARPAVWQPPDPLGPAMQPVTLGNDEYFVLADDRTRGLDSRHWGVLRSADLEARVWARFWPFSRLGSP